MDNAEFRAFRTVVIDEFHRFATVVEDDKEELDTKSAAYEAQREEADRKAKGKAFGEMSAQLAHQLRQPLNHIGISSGNLKARLEQLNIKDDYLENATERIERNVKRMNDQIEELSNLAKGLKEAPAFFDLGTFVQSVLYNHEKDYEQSGVDLNAINCANGHSVKFGKAALNFVLENLLTNALKAALNNPARRPSVAVEVEEIEAGYRVKVSDSGKGVPEKIGDRLFKEAMASEDGEGAGLFWSRIRAEQYGGKLGLEQDQSSGATFYVEL